MQVERYLTPGMLHSASENGLHIIILDSSRPLEAQGPFDAIVHKLPTSHTFYRQLRTFMEAHPACCIIDPLASIERVQQRNTMLSTFSPGVRFQMTVSPELSMQGFTSAHFVGNGATQLNATDTGPPSEASGVAGALDGSALNACVPEVATAPLYHSPSILEPFGRHRVDSGPQSNFVDRTQVCGTLGNKGQSECIVCAPQQCAVLAGTKAAEVEGILNVGGVGLPLLCKPLQSESSHAMVLITNKGGLQVRVCFSGVASRSAPYKRHT
jgi:hypothetical protein